MSYKYRELLDELASNVIHVRTGEMLELVASLIPESRKCLQDFFAQC